jgi:hypothetical protein
MIDIELSRDQLIGDKLVEIGLWLDANMPNPPLPEPQRWELGFDNTRCRTGIRFFDDNDALLFKLRW